MSHRVWLRPVRRPSGAIPATICWSPRARRAWAGCRRSWFPTWFAPSAMRKCSVRVRRRADRHPFAALDHAHEGLAGTLMLRGAERHRRRAEDIAPAVDLLHTGDEAVGRQVLAGILQRHDDQLRGGVAQLRREVRFLAEL